MDCVSVQVWCERTVRWNVVDTTSLAVEVHLLNILTRFYGIPSLYVHRQHFYHDKLLQKICHRLLRFAVSDMSQQQQNVTIRWSKKAKQCFLTKVRVWKCSENAASKNCFNPSSPGAEQTPRTLRSLLLSESKCLEKLKKTHPNSDF